MLRSKALDWLVLAFLVICWGSAFAALKLATAHIPPLWNTTARLLVAIPVLGVVLAATGHRLPGPRHLAWRFYAVIGFIGMAAPFTLYAFSAQGLPSAINAICNGATPIFTGLLAHLFIASERLTGRKAAGVAMGFVGLAVLVTPRLQHGFTVETAALTAALVGAALYAVASVLTKRAPAVPSAVGALMMCLWAALYAGAAAALMEPLPPWPPLSSMLAVAALGIFSTALATVGYVFLIQRRGPLFMSMGIYLAPVWATGLGMLALGERPGWSAFAALGLILAGVGLVTLGARPASSPAPDAAT